MDCVRLLYDVIDHQPVENRHCTRFRANNGLNVFFRFDMMWQSEHICVHVYVQYQNDFLTFAAFSSSYHRTKSVIVVFLKQQIRIQTVKNSIVINTNIWCISTINHSWSLSSRYYGDNLVKL